MANPSCCFCRWQKQQHPWPVVRGSNWSSNVVVDVVVAGGVGGHLVVFWLATVVLYWQTRLEWWPFCCWQKRHPCCYFCRWQKQQHPWPVGVRGSNWSSNVVVDVVVAGGVGGHLEGKLYLFYFIA